MYLAFQTVGLEFQGHLKKKQSIQQFCHWLLHMILSNWITMLKELLKSKNLTKTYYTVFTVLTVSLAQRSFEVS
jgi:hypothetical protein